MRSLSGSMYMIYYNKEVIMEELIREICENHFAVLAVLLTVFMFLLGGLLKLIEYVVSRLSDKEED